MSGFTFLKGRAWQRLPPEDQDNYVEEAFKYWRKRGFPFYSFTDKEIRLHFDKLCAANPERMFLPNDEIQWSNIGLALANYFHPQMWSVECDRYRSPMQCFMDDDALKACIRHALTIWPNRCGANASNLRRILTSFRKTKGVSNFRPTAAKALIHRHSPPSGRVLDFSAGFGGRLLGCLTLDRTYVGFEPCQQQFDGLQTMWKSIDRVASTSCMVRLHKACAEDAMPRHESESFDLIFTSPPYFDRERYSNEPTQSYIRYPRYSTWRKAFLHFVIAESHRLLKREGVLLLNVADTESAPVARHTKHFAARYLNLARTYHLRLGRLPYRPSSDTTAYHYEPVFVFIRTA